jgi:non-structural maintenance of chromosomes element 1
MFDKNNTPEREMMAVKTMEAIRLGKAPSDRDSVATQTQNGQTQGTGGPAASLTLDRAEKVLESLIDEGWLEKSQAGFLTLSPRALMELRSWLIDTYNDPPEGPPEDEENREWQKIKSCEGCKQIVTVVSITHVWRRIPHSYPNGNKTNSTLGPTLL